MQEEKEKDAENVEKDRSLEVDDVEITRSKLTAEEQAIADAYEEDDDEG